MKLGAASPAIRQASSTVPVTAAVCTSGVRALRPLPGPASRTCGISAARQPAAPRLSQPDQRLGVSVHAVGAASAGEALPPTSSFNPLRVLTKALLTILSAGILITAITLYGPKLVSMLPEAVSQPITQVVQSPQMASFAHVTGLNQIIQDLGLTQLRSTLELAFAKVHLSIHQGLAVAVAVYMFVSTATAAIFKEGNSSSSASAQAAGAGRGVNTAPSPEQTAAAMRAASRNISPSPSPSRSPSPIPAPQPAVAQPAFVASAAAATRPASPAPAKPAATRAPPLPPWASITPPPETPVVGNRPASVTATVIPPAPSKPAPVKPAGPAAPPPPPPAPAAKPAPAPVQVSVPPPAKPAPPPAPAAKPAPAPAPAPAAKAAPPPPTKPVSPPTPPPQAKPAPAPERKPEPTPVSTPAPTSQPNPAANNSWPMKGLVLPWTASATATSSSNGVQSAEPNVRELSPSAPSPVRVFRDGAVLYTMDQLTQGLPASAGRSPSPTPTVSRGGRTRTGPENPAPESKPDSGTGQGATEQPSFPSRGGGGSSRTPVGDAPDKESSGVIKQEPSVVPPSRPGGRSGRSPSPQPREPTSDDIRSSNNGVSRGNRARESSPYFPSLTFTPPVVEKKVRPKTPAPVRPREKVQDPVVVLAAGAWAAFEALQKLNGPSRPPK